MSESSGKSCRHSPTLNSEEHRDVNSSLNVLERPRFKFPFSNSTVISTSFSDDVSSEDAPTVVFRSPQTSNTSPRAFRICRHSSCTMTSRSVASLILLYLIPNKSFKNAQFLLSILVLVKFTSTSCLVFLPCIFACR